MPETIESAVSAVSGGVRLRLHVHPGAKRNAPAGLFGNSLKLELQAPPVEGKANAALLKLLAQWFSLPKSAISLVFGETGREKIVEIRGISPQQLMSTIKECYHEKIPH